MGTYSASLFIYKTPFVPFHSKVEDANGDNETFWDAMLNADRRDYERICSEYNVTDLQMILKKLEEKKTAREQNKNQVWKQVSHKMDHSL